MWRSRAALAALLLAGGCARAPRSRFPIGLFNVEDPAHLTRVRDAGFDHVFPVGTPVKQTAVSLEAARQGMKVVASPAVSRDATELKRWPVSAWYLQDEPDVNKVSPERLREIAAKVRAWDPRAQTFTVGQGKEAGPYGAIGDIFMLDWYPVPHLALDSVADQIDTAIGLLPKGKPLWFVAQAFDWRDDKNKIGRFPTHEEIRFMSWLAIMHGAKGLWYFRFPKPEGKTLFDYPEQWSALELVARELKRFQPVLEMGEPAPLPFPSGTSGLEFKSWLYDGRQFVLVLNRKRESYFKLPDELLKPEWTLVGEPQAEVKERLKAAHGAWYVLSYQVLLFEKRL